jgi:peptidoglycan-associated lipoprotein
MSKTKTLCCGTLVFFSAAILGGCSSWPVVPQTPPSIRQHSDLRADTVGEFLTAVTVNDVYFNAGESVLQNDERDALTRAAPAINRILRNYSDLVIVIEGHTDDGGSRKFNRELGKRRADAVREILVGAGVPAQRLRTASIADHERQCRLPDDGCHQKNRRVHLRGARFAREKG